MDPPTLDPAPGVVAMWGGPLPTPAPTGSAGKGAVFPVMWWPDTVLWWWENLHSRPAKVRQASTVLPDQTQNPEVIPTARLMKYLSMRTEKSG